MRVYKRQILKKKFFRGNCPFKDGQVKLLAGLSRRDCRYSQILIYCIVGK